jgi:hypothetical protein
MPSAAERRRVYSTIPDDTDIIITHGAPVGVLDMALGSNYHGGDPELLEAVQRVQPMLHVFGHIHGAVGDGDHLRGTRAGRCRSEAAQQSVAGPELGRSLARGLYALAVQE